MHVLDAGCGSGVYAEELLKRGAHVVSVDASDRMIELARERLGSNATIHNVDLSGPLTMFRDGQFDLVLAPLCGDPHPFIGLVLACRYCGLLDASLRAHERAQRIDSHAQTAVMFTLFHMGRYEDVIEWGRGLDGLIRVDSALLAGRHGLLHSLTRRESTETGLDLDRRQAVIRHPRNHRLVVRLLGTRRLGCGAIRLLERANASGIHSSAWCSRAVTDAFGSIHRRDRS